MSASEDAGARDNAAAPGVALRAARNAQNLSVGEVARQLRLSVAQIEALEASAFERLPGQVFVRGFMRNYARLLKLDPEPLLRDLAPAASPEQEPRVASTTRAESLPAGRPARWPWYALALATLIGALAVYEFVLDDVPQPALRNAARGDIVPAPVPTPQADASLAASTPARTGSEAQDAPAGTEPGAPLPVAAEPATPAVAASAARPAALEGEIRMTFERDSWVEIRDAGGRTLLSQLNRGGSEQLVTGRPPLVVVIGNARGVRLTYNDRVVDLAPYMNYDVARLTLE